jgi:serine/threonine-protein kinase SRPK3
VIDFTAANILLQLANIDEWTVDQIHERLGKPQTQNLHRRLGGEGDLSSPRYTISTINMVSELETTFSQLDQYLLIFLAFQKLVDPKWLSDQIMIIDFGIAFLQEQSSTEIGTPRAYCGPEFNFGDPRSINSDTWALGCTIFEIRTGACLFRYRGVPTRDQVLVSMVQMLGKLPEIWWKEWEEGHNWYDIEVQSGGEMADSAQGNLHHQIMEIGIHDGDAATDPSLYKNHDLKHETLIESERERERERLPNSSQAHRESTNRLIALVEELTTSEAADVMEQINKPPSSGSSQEKSASGSSNKNNSGSGAASGSSAAKSGEKSIASEGISTSVPAASGDILTTMERPTSDHSPEKLTALVTIGIAEFLEPTGTTISLVEADGLENLLREALAFLPEQRVTPLELTKHHWFVDNYEAMLQTGAAPLKAS